MDDEDEDCSVANSLVGIVRDKEYIKQYNKIYYAKNKDKYNKYYKKYMLNDINRENRKKYQKEYRLKNLERIKEYKRKYYLKNKFIKEARRISEENYHFHVEGCHPLISFLRARR